MTETNHKITFLRLSGLPGLAIYVGCGALLHAIIVGPQFDWSSAWTWGWLLGWPIALVIAFWAFILGAMVIGFGLVLLVLVGVFVNDRIQGWRRIRRRRVLGNPSHR